MTVKDVKRSMKTIGIVLIVYALLVATHEGEFWPFSIYPMFSQAGNQWTRAMVIDVTDADPVEFWQPQSLDDKSGPPVPLRAYGVDQIDYSNFISQTKNWTPQRRDALRHMFGADQIGENRWLAAKVHGEMIGENSVSVRIEPFLLMTADSVYMNPLLDESHYFENED
jgi:hypothetical protein